MTDSPSTRPKWFRIALVLVPLWLFASGGAALWYYFHREKKQAHIEQARFTQSISIPVLADDLKKIVSLIGERNTSSEIAAQNLSSTAAMIEGMLGPTNTGYAVKKIKGPREWPLLQVTLKSKKPDAPAIWIVSSFDSKPGSPGAEANATGLASTMAAAQQLAGSTFDVDLHFVFIPHANDPESPIVETAAKLKEIAPLPKAILCVEAMGGGSELWLSSRETNALPLGLTKGLGSVHGSEVVCLGDDFDLSSTLFEMGFPAVRVATRPILTAAEPDDKIPSAEILAASTGRLVELIRRCASLK
ncbi:MAG: hypothetical protein H8M99_09925 [Gloeobacteraceae cyanobacterium ES-bin-144]|nr:hypothetical protein [Verrucomicrobiales bacterium]